jgi:hypothetical protein
VCGTSCVNTQTDNANCGMCSHPCSTTVTGASASCGGGTCTTTCNTSGYKVCGTTCVNENSDLSNCGACGHACTTTVTGAVATCSGGTCGAQCTTSGNQVCGTACVNESTDLNNCGACGHACTTTVTGAVSTCSGGTCGAQCTTTGNKICGTACINPQTDNNNCGGCGQVCSGGQVCTAGACQCPSGTSLCGGATCVSLSGSANCGRCGYSCGGGACSGTTCGAWRVYSEPNTNLYIGGAEVMAFDGTYLAYEEAGMRLQTTLSVVNIFGGTPILLDDGTVDGAANVNVANGRVYWTAGSSSTVGTVTTNTFNTVSSPGNAKNVTTVVGESWNQYPLLNYGGLAVDSAGQAVYGFEIDNQNKYTIEVTPATGGITSFLQGDQSGTYDSGLIYNQALSAGANPGYLFYVLASASAGAKLGLEELNLNTGVNDVLLALTNVQNNGGPEYLVSDGTYVYFFEPAANPNAPTIIRIQQGHPVASEPSAFYAPGLQASATSSFMDALAYDSGNLYFAHSKTTGIWYLDYVPTGNGNIAAGTATNLYTAPSGTTIGSVRAANGYVVWVQQNSQTFVSEIWAMRHP